MALAVFAPGDCRPRRARASPLQQGPVHAQVSLLSVPHLPQSQVRAHAARRTSHRPLHDITQGFLLSSLLHRSFFLLITL